MIISIEELYNEYKEYCKKDKHPLPYIIWLKHKKKLRVKGVEDEEL